MSVDLQAKINNYIKTTPGMKIAPFDVVLQSMLAENKLTKTEYDELMRTSVFLFNIENLQGDDVNEIWGLNLSDKVRKSFVIEQPQKKFEQVSKEDVLEILSVADKRRDELIALAAELGIELNDRLEFKYKEIKIEYLKDIFDEEKYDIQEDNYSFEVNSKENEGEFIYIAKDGCCINKFKNYGSELITGFYAYNTSPNGTFRVTSINGNDSRLIYNEKGKIASICFGNILAEVKLDENQNISCIEHKSQEHFYETTKREDRKSVV